MDYKISNICSELGIGKSTVYKRIDFIKKNIPKTDWKNNEYYYYTKDNKLFITEKGFEYIKSFKTNNVRQNMTSNINLYQEQIIEMYKNRIDYLENENKRLLDIISLKEQKEIAKDVKYINSCNNNSSFLDKLFNKFKK